MTQHHDALAWAQHHLGKHEDPTGSNRGEFVQLCQRSTWLAGTGWPWCCGFALAAWKHGANAILPYRGAGAYAWHDWAKAHGWTRRLKDCVPGDFVVFNIGAGHMAVLERYDAAAGVVHTLDGNVSDMSARRTRPVSLVRGGTAIHVPEGRPHELPPAKPPLYEVVTSAGGTSQVIYVSGAKAISKRLDRILRKHGRVTIRRRKK